MSNDNLILVAEDDFEIYDILMSYIKRAGMKAVHAAEGESALALIKTLQPDLVLLDIQLPLIDGWNVLSTLRKESNTPVIMVTALDQDIDKLMGLRLGADDYIVKPFNPSEVVARIEAVLRRAKNQAVPQSLIRTRFMTIYTDEFCVEIHSGGQTFTPVLTTTEFKLLTHMAKYPRKVFSREELLNACLPESDTLDRTVDSHMSKLRKKFEGCGLNGVPESIRGIGYRLGEQK
ncbi:response regulator [Pantoea ananatis]|uniref:response regulator n=1 Tax=Pantoea ananas TaxID=553 RepID=UPI001D18B26E|nr:response regulator [Pantoea ananatis]UEG19080.1 response regulator [Pantoea ananatis]